MIRVDGRTKAMQDNGTETNTPRKEYILRILSGPHTGAEITLSENKKFLLGKGEDCDITLKDDQLADKHAMFSFQNDHFVCTPNEGTEVVIDGEKIHEPQALRDFAAIVCGATLLSIGPNDTVWPNIQPQAPKEPKPQEETPAEKTVTESAPTPKSHKNLKKIAILSALLIALSIGIFCGIKAFKREPVATEELTQFPIVSLKKSIESVLEKNNVDSKYVTIGLSGKNFTLQCYVTSNEEKNAIEKQLRGLQKVNFQSMRIYVQNFFIEQAQTILAPYLTVTAAPGAEPDGITLKGYLFQIDQLPKIKADLFRDIRGLNKIDTMLLSADEAFDLASNLLTQYKLMGLLKIQTIKTGVMITGHIPSSAEQHWKQAQKALKQAFENACKVLSYVAIVVPQAVKKLFFPSEITTVAVPQDDKPWIELKSGDRYFEGALLPSGYKIQAITTDGINIQKNEESIFFALSEL